MFQVLEKVSCGVSDNQPLLSGIPSKLPKLTSEIFTLILVAVPVLLVIMGTIDLFKGITADKEDEMVKGRKLFIKRLITGSLVFFLFTITKFVISIVDNKSNSARILNCVDCFINNKNCNTDINKEEPIEDENPTDDTYVEQNVTYYKDKEEQQSTKEKLASNKIGSFTKSSSGLNYFLYVPQGSTKGMPLVIFLHGKGEQNNIEAVKKLGPVTSVTNGSISGVENFIFLAPASPGNKLWHESATWDKLINLIDTIVSEYSIDTSRIYITGFSAGGCGVWGLVNKYPNKFRAAVPVSCSPGSVIASNFKNTPIYAIAGESETSYVNGMKNVVNTINNAGGNAQFKSIPNANHVKTQSSYSTKELYTWLLSQ